MRIDYNSLKDHVASNVIASSGGVRIWYKLQDSEVEYVVENMETKKTHTVPTLKEAVKVFNNES